MNGAEIAKTVTPPPMPWNMRGRMYLGLYRVDGAPAPPMPEGMQTLLGNHRVIMLVRYLEGTLRYDEFVIARLARRGLVASLFVDHIWVDSEQSVAGGRNFWGLPKEMAQFTWDGDRVAIHDAGGDVALLSVDQSASRLPAVPVVAPGFGVRDDGRVLLTTGRLKVRLRRPSLQIESLAPRFGALASGARVGFDASPFEMVIGAPRVLD